MKRQVNSPTPVLVFVGGGFMVVAFWLLVLAFAVLTSPSPEREPEAARVEVQG
jgi:hypothetical protein